MERALIRIGPPCYLGLINHKRWLGNRKLESHSRPARRSSCLSRAVCLCGLNTPPFNGYYMANIVTRNDTGSDLFHWLPDQRVLVCRVCRADVVPQHLVTHIRAHHRRLYSDFQTERATIE
jgi:hypothetical protein